MFQRGIMGAMTVDEIYKDRKKFSNKVFDIASTDLFNMGIQVRNISRPKGSSFIIWERIPSSEQKEFIII